MNYEEFLVSVEIAEALKKIGFDKDDEKIVKLYEYKSKEIIEPTWEFHYRCNYFRHFLSHRDEYCPLFTYEQVFAWFREKGYQFQVGRVCFADEFIPEFWDNYYCEIYLKETDDTLKILTYTYEEARLDCIRELIKIYKENI